MLSTAGFSTSFEREHLCHLNCDCLIPFRRGRVLPRQRGANRREGEFVSRNRMSFCDSNATIDIDDKAHRRHSANRRAIRGGEPSVYSFS
jgi:hypothetical protein